MFRFKKFKTIYFYLETARLKRENKTFNRILLAFQDLKERKQTSKGIALRRKQYSNSQKRVVT